MKHWKTYLKHKSARFVMIFCVFALLISTSVQARGGECASSPCSQLASNQIGGDYYISTWSHLALAPTEVLLIPIVESIWNFDGVAIILPFVAIDRQYSYKDDIRPMAPAVVRSTYRFPILVPTTGLFSAAFDADDNWINPLFDPSPDYTGESKLTLILGFILVKGLALLCLPWWIFLGYQLWRLKEKYRVLGWAIIVLFVALILLNELGIRFLSSTTGESSVTWQVITGRF